MSSELLRETREYNQLFDNSNYINPFLEKAVEELYQRTEQEAVDRQVVLSTVALPIFLYIAINSIIELQNRNFTLGIQNGMAAFWIGILAADFYTKISYCPSQSELDELHQEFHDNERILLN